MNNERASGFEEHTTLYRFTNSWQWSVLNIDNSDFVSNFAIGSFICKTSKSNFYVKLVKTEYL